MSMEVLSRTSRLITMLSTSSSPSTRRILPLSWESTQTYVLSNLSSYGWWQTSKRPYPYPWLFYQCPGWIFYGRYWYQTVGPFHIIDKKDDLTKSQCAEQPLPQALRVDTPWTTTKTGVAPINIPCGNDMSFPISYPHSREWTRIATDANWPGELRRSILGCFL